MNSILERYSLDDPKDWSLVIYEPSVGARPTASFSDRPVPDFAQMEYRRAIVNAFNDKPEEPLTRVWVSIYLPALPDVWCAHATKNVQDALVYGRIIRGDRGSVEVLRAIKASSPYEGASFIEVNDLDGSGLYASLPIAYPSAARTIPASYSQTSESIELVGLDEAYQAALVERYQQLDTDGKVRYSIDITSDDAFQAKSIRVLVGENSGMRTRRFDPDNVALRMLDMLEARRQTPPFLLDPSTSPPSTYTPVDQLVGGFDVVYTPELEGVVLALSTLPVLDEAYAYFSRYMPSDLR
ncbi:MAG: hypothetical protein Q7W51_04970 [Coriobacteriia bacterium]|nr:hypothetical protein [Coriobacteriia bacterium]